MSRKTNFFADPPHWPPDRRRRLRWRIVNGTMCLLLLGFALWVWLNENSHTVTVDLPQSGAELVYTRIAMYLGFAHRREIAIPGIVPPHNDP